MTWPRTVRRLPRAALGFWRRSLRTRVVTAIVVLSALVVGSVGWMVIRQIADGLVTSRVDGSLAEARTETAIVRERLGPAGGNDFDPDTQLRLLVETLVARGDAKGFEVVVQGPVGDGASPSGVRTTPGVDAASVPASLRRAVEDGEQGLAWTYTRIRYAGAQSPGSRSPSPSRAWPSAPPWCCPPTAAATRSTTCSRWARSSRRCSCCARCCWWRAWCCCC